MNPARAILRVAGYEIIAGDLPDLMAASPCISSPHLAQTDTNGSRILEIGIVSTNSRNKERSLYDRQNCR